MNILRVKRKCIELLERVDCDGAYLHLVLQEAAHGTVGDPEEYPLVVQFVRGVSEQKRVLEEVLNRYLPKGLASLPQFVQYVLLLGAYQILFLERAKKRNVVFEAVELVKGSRWKGLASLVNAVLRKIEPAVDGAERVGSQSGTANFPEWLISRWCKQFGEEEVKAFCRASDAKLPLYLRVRTGRTTPAELQTLLRHEGVDAAPSRFSDVSLQVSKLPSSVRVHELKSYKAGLFFVQDLSSTVVADLASIDAPQSVRDLCAAPGGKACSIALSIEERGGRVVASDRLSDRVALIVDLAARLELPNVHSELLDLARDERRPQERYDVVLLDAPCSGFGTVGRKVDARWSKSLEDIHELVSLQSTFLDRASEYVLPGGRLVYSTCTIDKEENEQVIFAFIARNPEWVVEPLDGVIDPSLCTPEGFYRAWPQHHAMAGAFAARLRRKSP